MWVLLGTVLSHQAQMDPLTRAFWVPGNRVVGPAAIFSASRKPIFDSSDSLLSWKLAARSLGRQAGPLLRSRGAASWGALSAWGAHVPLLSCGHVPCSKLDAH